MLLVRAVLIQDISEYLFFVKQAITVGIKSGALRILSPTDKILKWVITKEIEDIYLLFDEDHFSKEHDNRLIHSYLSQVLYPTGITLSVLTARYIKVPRLYPDNHQIRVKLNGRDLYIEYFEDRDTDKLGYERYRNN